MVRRWSSPTLRVGDGVYSWIWRHLPGSTPVKIAIAIVAVGAIVVLLFAMVFPWITPRLPFTDVTIGVIDLQGVLP